MKYLVITMPKNLSFFDTIYMGLPTWKSHFLDRDALELSSYLKSNGHEVNYIPANLIYQFFSSDCEEEMFKEIIQNDFDYLIFCSHYFNEMTSYKTMDNIIEKLISKGICNYNNILMVGKIYDYTNIYNNFSFIGSYERLYEFLISNVNYRIKKKYESFKYLPSYELISDYLNIVSKNKKRKIMMGLQLSNRCPYSCKYCSTNNTSVKQKFIKIKFLEEEIRLIDKYIGLNLVYFDCILDDSFGYAYDIYLEYIKLLKAKKINIKYCLMNVNSILSTDILIHMKDFCDCILIGVETFNDDSLNKVGKNQNIRDVLKAMQKVKKLGFKTHLNWIVGLPGESIKNMWVNFKVIAYLMFYGLADEVEPQLLTVCPWTDLYKNRDEFGIKLINTDYRLYDEQGFISSIEYDQISNSELEKVYLLMRLYISRYNNLRTKYTKEDDDVDDIIDELNNFVAEKNNDIFYKTIGGMNARF